MLTGFSGNLDATYATDIQLATTGSTLDNKINSLSGWSASTTNLYTTGLTLDSKINSLSGWSASAVNLISTGATLITNLFNTGSNLNTKIDNLSGYVNTQDNNISSNLSSTGTTLNNKINSLSGWSASSTNLVSTGSTLDNKINSLSGYVTTVDATFATIINLASTGSTLDSKINSLSGWSASAVNLASTGSTLNNRINNLSGYINSTSSNIVFTTGNQTISGVKTFVENTTFGDSAQGDFLVISGNNFTVYGSGNFTSGLFVNGNAVLTGNLYATTVNLASTGSTLDNKINNLSGVSVLTFGNQTINGLKTFTSGIDIYSGVSPQSIRIFNKTGTNTGEFGLIGWQNNTLVIGSQNTNSGTLRDIRLTGANINLSATDAVIITNVNPVGSNSFIIKDGNGNNGLTFNPAQQGGAGLLGVNFISTIGVNHQGDYDLRLGYGGGGTRSITFFKDINRAMLDSNGNFGIASGISSVPSRFYVSGDSILQGNLTVSGNVNISGNYDIYSQIENTKKLAIAYAIAL
jgi:hypothetical protein